MSRKTKIGDVCAYLGMVDGKGKYCKIGVAFTDAAGRISLKIDSLPLPESGWQGWVNIFEDTKSKPSSPSDIPETDIPF
jgi:hypothetical protein